MMFCDGPRMGKGGELCNFVMASCHVSLSYLESVRTLYMYVTLICLICIFVSFFCVFDKFKHVCHVITKASR